MTLCRGTCWSSFGCRKRMEHSGKVNHTVLILFVTYLQPQSGKNGHGFPSQQVARCFKIGRHLKHIPTNAQELIEQQVALGQKQECLVQDVTTRWNSTLEMVQLSFVATCSLTLACCITAFTLRSHHPKEGSSFDL